MQRHRLQAISNPLSRRQTTQHYQLKTFLDVDKKCDDSFYSLLDARRQAPHAMRLLCHFVRLVPRMLIIELEKFKEGTMLLVCPRCATDVTEEALYCPYCNLPRPKAGFGKPGAPSPPRKLTTQAVSRKSQKSNYRSPGQPRNTKRKVRLVVSSFAALVAVSSVALYIFVVPLVHSQGVEPKIALSALDRLQRMPSNDPDLTIDARLSRELEKSRRVGNLVGYQGWTVHPIKGTKTRVLLVFAYREVGNTEQRAEWLADLDANTFAPQTALAVLVSK